jgi:hypothetical protein
VFTHEQIASIERGNALKVILRLASWSDGPHRGCRGERSPDPFEEKIRPNKKACRLPGTP